MSNVDYYLRGLQERFIYIANKIERIQLKVDRRNPETIEIAASELSEVIKDLQDLQQYQRSLYGTDNIANQVQNSIGTEIDELLEQTKGLFNQLKSIADRIKGGSDRSFTESQISQHRDLSRNEIAKVLLLISRAYSIKQIDLDQKSRIKSEVCAKKGYLRGLLLEQDDLLKVMATLKSLPYTS